MAPFMLLSAVFVSFAVALSVIAAPSKTKFDWAKTKYFYAFGDSYTFVQGTKGYANFSFIGDAFDFSYTPHELLSNEIIPKNTSSDGSNWTEFLTGCYEGKPSNCAPHQLWNFAFAGADIDKTLLPLHHNFSVDLTDQVKQWVTYGADVVPHPADETLVAWWIGINDTGDTIKNSTLDFQAFWQTEMKYLMSAVTEAYEHNLRGTYLFFNVPPMQRSPGQLNTSTNAFYAQNIVDYNTALASHVSAFAHAHPDVTVLTFDAHTWFGEILDNAAHYGFKNITGYCECTDDTYFWYNTGHPTQHVHRLLAQAVEAELLRASTAPGKPHH